MGAGLNIVMVHEYTAPAKNAQGAARMVESLSRELARKGHNIYLLINERSITDIAPIVRDVPSDCDIVHYHSASPDTHGHDPDAFRWISTPHGGGTDTPEIVNKHKHLCNHIVFVSKFCADLYGSSCFVHVCADPNDLVFRQKKDDYFLWIGSTDWGDEKGLFISILMAKKMGIKLKIAGGGKNQQIIDHVKSSCNDKIEYLGFVNGKEKAELIAGAKALLMLGGIPDACPLTVIESLGSGVPIIASTAGSYPELVNDKVGFICHNRVDFYKAVANIGKIDPVDCRNYFLSEFTPEIAAKRYLEVYNNMINFGDVRKSK